MESHFDNDEDEFPDEKETTIGCSECHKQLPIGHDVVATQHGVVIPKGFVDLEDPIHFCTDECVARFFDEHKPNKLPRRIP